MADTPDERPRPQYGEYASPEEQRARIAKPDVTWELESGQASPQSASQPVPPPPSEPPAGATGQSADAAASAVPRRRLADRIATYALLGYGLYTVVTAIPQYTDYGQYATTILEVMGVDAALSDPAAGRPWGLAAALVLGLGWLATAVLSWLNLRRGRVSWWIPLVGGVVFTFVSAMLILVPLLSDPAVQQGIIATTGG